MAKIIVKHCRIEVNNYELGDCPSLEHFFTIFDPITHSCYLKGLEYDKDRKVLILPRGLDISWLERALNGEAQADYNYDEFDYVSEPIMIKNMPRDNEQIEALQFILGKGKYHHNSAKSQLGINLNTGKGKTYVTVFAISHWLVRSMVIANTKGILEQWKDRILEYTDIKPKEIYLIEGSNSIDRLYNRDLGQYKIYLASHATLKSYGDKNGWDKITQLFKYLKIGIKVYDEAHQNFDNILKIDFHTNTYKNLYLTATPKRSAQNEDQIYQLAFKNMPKIDLFNEDKDPHTQYIAMHFNSRPSPDIISRCKNKFGFNRLFYIDWVIDNERFLNFAYILMDKIFNLTKDGTKALIYIGTNKAIGKFYDFLVGAFPQYKHQIGIYTSIVPDDQKEDMLNKRIILSTTKSCGAGMDIHGLKVSVVLAEPFRSEVLTRQTLGRTRANNTLYIDCIDDGFFYCKSYFNSKKPIFSKYATKCTNIATMNDFEIQDRIKTIDEKPKLFCPVRRLKENEV